MTKLSNKKRKASQQPSNTGKKQHAEAISSTPATHEQAELKDAQSGAEEELIGGLIFGEELDSTVEVLQTLAQNPAILKSKSMKPFKSAMYECWRSMQEVSGTGTSLTSRISTTLQSSLHLESLVLLSELRLRGQTPKLGSLQRWVRECDAAAIATASSTRKRSKAEEEQEERLVWEVLDALLRSCTTLADDVVAEVKDGEVESDVKRGGKGVRRWKPWDVRKLLGEAHKHRATGRNYTRAVEEDTLVSSELKELYRKSVVPLDVTPGPSRRPPNLFPAIVYHVASSSPDTLTLASTPTQVAKRFDVPGVPGALIITDLLSKEECEDLIGMSETIGMIEDQPVGGSAAELNSVLAHNLILLAPSQFSTPLFERVRNLLPSHVSVPNGSKSSGALKGINRRYRIYRYKEGSVYRPHIDGSWPSSAELPASEDGLSPAKYVYDSDPTLYSRYTFLIYLNDSFSNGCTTFFVPDPDRDGVLDARPVRPLAGSALVFPHGATLGSLLHEGSPVFPNELEHAKYVIRTEVLYEVDRIASAGEGGVVGGLV
ncbi:Prolyl 4-hydroxylase, alpha subunit [Phaffia rhodozyma]|uniref:Prolyl 4-hydroxylase, alpha subunit n=1 Tax=Phaffia rhodozyma TaxID=264483 RepID=A0A0F7STM6_PHARH|nr:Prolyl 4-hydroxylase, alpha subunit [Phaffia rhodozyma]